LQVIAAGRSRNALLQLLSTATAASVAPHLHEVHFPAHEVLNEPGDEVEAALFPHSGMISLLAVMRDGSAIETATIGREGAIGLMAGLGLHVTTTRVVAQTPVVASSISAIEFRKLVQAHHDLNDLVVRYHEVLLAQVQITAACNAVHNLEARLARWILQTRDRFDDGAIPLTQELLSEMLGVRRSSVSEVASKLHSAGLISYARGKIKIDDRDGLERAACECYQSIAESAAIILKR
jgi:CRP-like cAMP-binding protein